MSAAIAASPAIVRWLSIIAEGTQIGSRPGGAALVEPTITSPSRA